MTARFLTWNIDRKHPGTPQAQELLRRISKQSAEVICLTEAFEGSLAELRGHQIAVKGFAWAGAVAIAPDEREVLLWSRHPWTDVRRPDRADLRRGGFISGKTTTSIGQVRVNAICAPYHRACVPPRPQWWEQERFLAGLRDHLVARDDGSPSVLIGDFNQYLPRIWGKKTAHAALERALGTLSVVTSGVLPGVGAAYVDHIALSSELEAVDVYGVDQVHRGRRLTERHFGVVADLRVRKRGARKSMRSGFSDH